MATVGEISDALEKVYGRHAGQIRTISGVYRKEAGESPSVDRTRALVDAFEEAEGRLSRASWSPRWARTATTGGRR